VTGSGKPRKAAVEELERAGVLVDGRLEGYAARMMAVIADPQLRVMIERFAAGPPQYGPFAAVRGEFGVWAEKTREGTTEFTPVEPSLVPWAVATAVGLGPRPEQDFEGTLELPASALQLALDRLADQDTESAARELELATDLDERERKLLVALLLQRRLSWSAFSMSGESLVASVATIDGGAGGLWFSEHVEPDSADPVVRLEPTTSGAVWERIVALVPVPVPSDG
jgi:EspG family